MNHDLFDDGPDPTPTPAPAAAIGPIPSSHGHDDDDDTTRRTKLAPRAQKFLADQRRELRDLAGADHKLKLEYKRKLQASYDLIMPVLPRVLDKTHVGSWDEVWSLVEGLYLLFLEESPFAIALSGWCATAKDLSGPPMAPTLKLLDLLGFYGVYGRASTLAAAYIAVPTDDNADALWSWVRTWPDLFNAALVGGHWTAGRIKKLSDHQLVKRKLDLEAEFLFLERRVFWFTPAAADPSSGWNDFYFFALGYHYLPTDLKNDLGPYSLTIRTSP